MKFLRADGLRQNRIQDDGYPDAEVFIAAFKKATEIVEQYRRDLSDWERKVKSNQAPDR